MPLLLDTVSPLDRQPLDADEVVSGHPEAGSRALTSLNEIEVGVWEMTPGVATDVEADEVFVVLSGSADVTFEDGTVLSLHAGSVVRLYAGESTTWTVHETLRKVYVA